MKAIATSYRYLLSAALIGGGILIFFRAYDLWIVRPVEVADALCNEVQTLQIETKLVSARNEEVRGAFEELIWLCRYRRPRPLD
jgi:hypothetical protein